MGNQSFRFHLDRWFQHKKTGKLQKKIRKYLKKPRKLDPRCTASLPKVVWGLFYECLEILQWAADSAALPLGVDMAGAIRG